jgi:hypothetical protein
MTYVHKLSPHIPSFQTLSVCNQVEAFKALDKGVGCFLEMSRNLAIDEDAIVSLHHQVITMLYHADIIFGIQLSVDGCIQAYNQLPTLHKQVNEAYANRILLKRAEELRTNGCGRFG